MQLAIVEPRTPRHNVISWINRLIFLTVHTAADRYHSGFASLIFAIIEPLGIIGLLTATNVAMGTRPSFGDSHLLFLSSGVVPFYLLFHIGIRLRTMDRFVHLPNITKFDEILARTLAELITKLVFFVALSFTLYLIASQQWYPANPIRCLCALVSICALGVGVGIICAVISTYVPVFWYAYVLLMRCMLLISAAPMVMDREPPPFRYYTLCNPLAHFITWFRSGWYTNFPVATLDLTFAFKSIVVALFVAFVFERSTRRVRNIL